MENCRNLTEDEKRTLIQDIIGAQQAIQEEEDDNSKTITETNVKVNVDMGPLYELASKVSNMIAEAFHSAAMHMNKVTNGINDSYIKYLKDNNKPEQGEGE